MCRELKDKEYKFGKLIDLYNDYFQIYTKEIPKFSYRIADDMVETFKQLAETEEQIAQWKKYSDKIRKNNGTVVFTRDNRLFIILVNENLFNDKTLRKNDEYVHTVTHEYTHLLDYYKYMKENNINNYDEFLKDKYSDVFYLWAEYHARFISTKIYYKHIIDYGILKEKIVT